MTIDTAALSETKVRICNKPLQDNDPSIIHGFGDHSSMPVLFVHPRFVQAMSSAIEMMS